MPNFPRKSAAQRGYGSRWQRARATFLSRPENALCVYCKRQGLIRSATVVDHIRPHRGDQKLFWDTSNWQGLCETCHNAKAAQERASYRTGNPVVARGCGSDGQPIDPAHPWNQ